MKDSITLEMRQVGREFQVDRNRGTLQNVALMTGNRAARGHDVFLDEKTLQTAQEAIQEQGGMIRGGIRHPSLTDLIDTGGDRVLAMPGFFRNTTVKRGNEPVLVAGEFEFYESFRRDEESAYNKLIEMAEKSPQLFGISLEIGGSLVFIDNDGNEHDVPPEDASNLAHGGMPVLRVSRVHAAPFVDRPAANDGLFAAFSSMFGGKRSDESIASAISEWMKLASADGNKDIDLQHNEHQNRNEMSKIEEIKALFAEDKELRGRALVLLSEDAELETGEIEKRLLREDKATAEARITELDTKVSELDTKLSETQTKLSQAETERDQYKAKLDSLDGHPGQVDLGAGGAGSGQVQEMNPWMPATRNFTAQARMLRENPEKAKAMQTAAQAV